MWYIHIVPRLGPACVQLPLSKWLARNGIARQLSSSVSVAAEMVTGNNLIIVIVCTSHQLEPKS